MSDDGENEDKGRDRTPPGELPPEEPAKPEPQVQEGRASERPVSEGRASEARTPEPRAPERDEPEEHEPAGPAQERGPEPKQPEPEQRSVGRSGPGERSEPERPEEPEQGERAERAGHPRQRPEPRASEGPAAGGPARPRPAYRGPADTGFGQGRGPANSGPARPGPANNGPANNGPANNGPANNGPVNPGPSHPGPERGPGPGQPPAARLTGRQRLAKAVWPPRVTRAQLIVAVLLFVLGLGLAIQVRSTSENSALRGARQEDLVRILDELDDRTKRLDDEKQSLERQRTELENSSDQAEEARRQTRQKARQLGVLAGTVAAEGPGIHLTISDPRGTVEADMLLDTVQELRAAGAEAIQVNDVRVVADTYFSDSGGGVSVDGHRISAPYRFDVIGKPKDLEPALNIPGGVVQTLRKEQAAAAVTDSEKVVVDALRPAKRPDYARSSSE